MNIVIFGAPGSGKGTQSEKIVEKYGLYHISTGDLLRENIRKGTHLGKVADTFISKGLLIPDELMIEVLADLFKSDPTILERGVIFDGFPRTIPKAEALAVMLGEHNTSIHAVVGLEVDEEELINRMIERGKSSGRCDDNLETIKKRLNVYHKQTAPLRDYYVKAGSYSRIDGNRKVDEIFGDISVALNPHKDKK